MLSGIRSYSKKEIMERLEISERNFYRYIKTLKDFGFIIDTSGGRYIIEKNNKTIKDLSDLLHFSEEESHILNEAINSIEASTKIKENLIGKLSALYDNDRIAIRFVTKEQSSKIKPLLEAIKNEKKVKVYEYLSSGSGKIGNRILEPFEFTPNFISVWAYEPESGKNKLFKVKRMKSVELTTENWSAKEKHKANLTDCFRIGGPKQIPLCFEMTLLAKNLLIEEYPLSEHFISSHGENHYRFNGWVTGFEGIGRFVLGLPGEIFNIENDHFLEFLNKKQKIFNFDK